MELQIRGDLDLHSFNPHGISVYTDDAGDEQTGCNMENRQHTQKHGVITMSELDEEEANVKLGIYWSLVYAFEARVSK